MMSTGEEGVSVPNGAVNRRVISWGNGRFPDNHFPGQTFPDKTFPGQDDSQTDVSRTICINNFEYFGMFT